MALSLNDLRDPMTVLEWVRNEIDELDYFPGDLWAVYDTIKQSLQLCKQIPPDPDPEVVRLKGILAKVARDELVRTRGGVDVVSRDALAGLAELLAEFAPEKNKQGEAVAM